MRQFYLLFRHFILLCLPLIIFSCNESTVDPELFGSVSGTVTTSEEAGSLPMEGVSITTNPGTTAVTTNSDGHFNLNEVKVGDVTVNAKKEGYTAVSIPVKVQEGKELVMQVVMGIAPPETAAPAEPVYALPLDATANLQTEVKLVWNNGKTEKGDTLFFNVILYEDGQFKGDTIAESIMDTTFVAKNLKFETNYRWKVDVSNRARQETKGRDWKFRTENFPKNGYLFVKDTLESRDIYSWDLAKNHLVRLTNDGGSEVSPRISPNEELIAYASNKSGEYHIYTMDTKGENVVKVTNDKAVAGYHNSGTGFVWSPEGDQILYGHYGDLYTINYNGTGETKIANAPVNRHFKSCDWSAHFNNVSKEKIAVLTQGEKPYDNEIYLMDPDGTNLFLLVPNLEGTISSPHFSPDGTKVIFSLDSLNEYDNGRQLNAKIYSVTTDGTTFTDLSGDDKTAGTNDLQSRYTETGGKIVFMNVANDNEGQKSIWIMDTDGSNREKIITNGEMPDLYNP
ncbi:carboxypeptidase regulatory-like domain-containing protein [Labilibaculum sp. K2S]|uniref:carboxypeptidase regulatory-like domain-containing protein n=1 Tax=Labilibaculum sp. K2S TaxID=3056386 RepID=UPI0025A32B5B|nr:carboxypeptidase regulatory-like domain-containing protein [Labilibaculum sp. K2S]MDM8158243.1 carboxypeptidase regulatory-like domain-containing protein [Labilibaculum sp. K2S]